MTVTKNTFLLWLSDYRADYVHYPYLYWGNFDAAVKRVLLLAEDHSFSDKSLEY